MRKRSARTATTRPEPLRPLAACKSTNDNPNASQTTRQDAHSSTNSFRTYEPNAPLTPRMSSREQSCVFRLFPNVATRREPHGSTFEPGAGQKVLPHDEPQPLATGTIAMGDTFNPTGATASARASVCQPSQMVESLRPRRLHEHPNRRPNMLRQHWPSLD